MQSVSLGVFPVIFPISDNKPNGNKYPPNRPRAHLSIIRCGSIDNDSSLAAGDALEKPRKVLHRINLFHDITSVMFPVMSFSFSSGFLKIDSE